MRTVNIVMVIIGGLLLVGVTQKKFMAVVMRLGKSLSWFMNYRSTLHSMTEPKGRESIAKAVVVCIAVVLIVGAVVTAYTN